MIHTDSSETVPSIQQKVKKKKEKKLLKKIDQNIM